MYILAYSEHMSTINFSNDFKGLGPVDKESIMCYNKISRLVHLIRSLYIIF